MEPVTFSVNGNRVSVRADPDKPLLDRNPAPSRREIAEALDDNICRCGSHNRILRAVERAAPLMRLTKGAKRNYFATASNRSRIR